MVKRSWTILSLSIIHLSTGRLSAGLNAYIGKEDVMLFAGGWPDSFKDAYPFRPLVVRAGTDGNLKQMQISRFTVDLPGAFSMKGGGILENLADSLTRSGTIGLDMITQNLNFLTCLLYTSIQATLSEPALWRCGASFAPVGLSETSLSMADYRKRPVACR